MNKPQPRWHDFEDEVFREVEQSVLASGLSVPSDAQVHRKKSYFSEQRDAEIEFEIAIEAFDRDATEPSIVWLWECKDHSTSERNVQVSDVEILINKIGQLGVGRFKGSLVTTHGYQSGAENLAISNGISLFVFSKQLVRVTQFDQRAREFDREDVCTNYWLGFDGKITTDSYRMETVVSSGLASLGIRTH